MTMHEHPTLETARFILRPLADQDGPRLAEICAPLETVRFTSSIPHPYTLDDAAAFIEHTRRGWADGTDICWAITRREDGLIVGTIGIRPVAAHRHAEFGYMIAREQWGGGIATEAARRIVAFGFDDLGLHRIHASYAPANPASGRILEKLGFIREGTLRQHYHRDGDYVDAIVMARLRSDP